MLPFNEKKRNSVDVTYVCTFQPNVLRHTFPLMFILQRTYGNYTGLKLLSMELRSSVRAVCYNRIKIKPQLSPGYNLDKNKEYTLIPLSTFKTFRFVSVISGNTFAMVFGMKKRFQRLKYLILLNHVRLFLSESTRTKQIFERVHWIFRGGKCTHIG